MPVSAEAFALAVAARHDHVRIAGRDAEGVLLNEYKRQRRWAGRGLPAGPYAVYLGDGTRFRTLVLDLDCDDPAARVHQLAVLSAVLVAAGVRFVQTRSGPSGRAHLLSTWSGLLTKAQVGTVMVGLVRLAADLDVSLMANAKTGSVRPPGSPHRHGGRSTVVGDEVAALAALQGGNDAATWDRLVQQVVVATSQLPGGVTTGPVNVEDALRRLPRSDGQPRLDVPRRELPARTQEGIRHGDLQGRYLDRSSFCFGLTTSVVQCGWSFAEYADLALARDAVGFDHLRRQSGGSGRYTPRSEPRKAAARMWTAALRAVLASPSQRQVAPDTAAELERIGRAVASVPWPGLAGASNRNVLLALLTAARARGSLEVTRSLRQLALDADLTKSSAQRAVSRLAQAGWLARDVAAGRASSTYRLLVPASVVGGTHALAPSLVGHRAGPELGACQVNYQRQSRHDAFHSAGLGQYARMLFGLLSERAGSLHELVSRSGLRCRAVRKHLGALADHSLIVIRGRVWHAVSGSAVSGLLDEAASRLGTAGDSGRRAAVYQAESATYAWFLSDVAAEAACRGQAQRRLGYLRARPLAAAPRMSFPRGTNGRRDWVNGLAMTLDGAGLQTEELAATDVHGRLNPVVATAPLAAQPARALPRRRNAARRPLPTAATANAGSKRPGDEPARAGGRAGPRGGGERGPGSLAGRAAAHAQGPDGARAVPQ